jgi:Zn-dependent peptidase ImmA (M78 family)
MRNVPFKPRKRIELEAQWLLADFGRAAAPVEGPPVPIEAVLEIHLGLGLALCNLRECLGVQDALGALCVESREVLVDESLDPEEFPDLEGRYRFTLAHEIGHWQLHRWMADSTPHQPAFLLRASPSDKRIEWQANYFASCLLMPRPLVFPRWREVLSGKVLSLERVAERRQELLESEIIRRQMVPADPADEDDWVLEGAVLPLAEEFRVSPQAMRIRLERLELVVR